MLPSNTLSTDSIPVCAYIHPAVARHHCDIMSAAATFSHRHSFQQATNDFQDTTTTWTHFELLQQITSTLQAPEQQKTGQSPKSEYMSSKEMMGWQVGVEQRKMLAPSSRSVAVTVKFGHLSDNNQLGRVCVQKTLSRASPKHI